LKLRNSNVKKKKMSTRTIGWLNLLMVISFVILVFAIVKYIDFKSDPDNASLLGYKPVIIRNDSMEPKLPLNSLVLVKPASFDDVDVGDIITYEVDGKFLTSEVASKNENGIRTQAASESVRSGYLLTDENIKGKVAHTITWTVGIAAFLKLMGQNIHYVLGGLCLLAIAIFVLVMKHKKKHAANYMDEDVLGISEEELEEAMAMEPVMVSRVGAAARRTAEFNVVSDAPQPVIAAEDEQIYAQAQHTELSEIEALKAELVDEIQLAESIFDAPVISNETKFIPQNQSPGEDFGDFVDLLGDLGMSDMFREATPETDEIYLKERDDVEIDNFFSKYAFA